MALKVTGLHTARYNDHEWSVVWTEWTDLSIEQSFMQSS